MIYESGKAVALYRAIEIELFPGGNPVSQIATGEGVSQEGVPCGPPFCF
jgi:hypothetical protein